jgi:hypothetical protein
MSLAMKRKGKRIRKRQSERERQRQRRSGSESESDARVSLEYIGVDDVLGDEVEGQADSKETERKSQTLQS